MKKYKANFIRDINFYFRMRNTFNFDGALNYYDKKGRDIIQYDKNGVDGIEAFYQFDSSGIIKPTKHPNILKMLLKVKGGTNLHIKMYAEDRAKCNMSLIEFRALCIKFKTPNWFREAVENQKTKHWNDAVF